MHSYERKLFHGYLQNILQSRQLTLKMYAELCDWLTDQLEVVFTSGLNEQTWRVIEGFHSAIKERAMIKKNQKKFDAEISRLLQENEADSDIKISPLAANLDLLARELNLDEVETKVFSLIAHYKVSPVMESLADYLGNAGSSALQTIALFLYLQPALVARSLSINGKLASTGIILLKTDRGNDLSDRFDMAQTIIDALVRTSDNPDDIRRHILGEPVKAGLIWDDFAHLNEIRNKLFNFLSNALKEQLQGVNILLWGPPGTGKTEFCKTLARQIGCTLYSIGETDYDGDEPSRRERLASVAS